jgi:hypothetical protein
VSLAAIAVTQGGDIGRLLQGIGHAYAATVAAWVLLVVYVAAALVASFFVVVVYVPTAPRRGAARTHMNSLFYFDDIQAMPVEEFEYRSRTHGPRRRRARRDSPSPYREPHRLGQADRGPARLLLQCAASDKLIGVQRAYSCSALALLAWMVLVLLAQL